MIHFDFTPGVPLAYQRVLYQVTGLVFIDLTIVALDGAVVPYSWSLLRLEAIFGKRFGRGLHQGHQMIGPSKEMRCVPGAEVLLGPFYLRLKIL
jgi:hypothetical protein